MSPIPCTILSSLVVALVSAQGSIPPAVDFKYEPVIFKKWDDGKKHHESTEALKKIDTMKKHFGRSEGEVKDKLAGAKRYYNSERAMQAMNNSVLFANRQFHTPFKVHFPKKAIWENEYMMHLGGLFNRPEGAQKLKVLDFGFGMGRFAMEIANTSCCVVRGLNIAENQVKVATENARSLLAPEKMANLEFKSYDGEMVPFADEEFDVVFFQESMFHVPNKCHVLKELARITKTGGKVVGLDWVTALGVTDPSYNYWIGAVNVGWEATIGSPEEFSKCMRAAGYKAVEYWSLEHMSNVEFKPRNQFAHVAKALEAKYGTVRAQLSTNSFVEDHRHLYALEAMALAIINYEYEEGIFTATKGVFPPVGSHGSHIAALVGAQDHISDHPSTREELSLNPSAAQNTEYDNPANKRTLTSFEEDKAGVAGEINERVHTEL
jgi:2-polyprenyl-3-methyl-5-hydroxy-6-metoxy-1,4-benzoquinol methylase